MSEIVKKLGESGLSNVIKTQDNDYYFVDSCLTYDAGYETMAFIWDKENEEVYSWNDIYAEHYSTEKQMEKGHKRICLNFEQYLKGEK